MARKKKTDLESLPVEEVIVPVMAPPDNKAELHRLEQVFERGNREAIIALRDIRDRKLYRHDGKVTFEDYVAERWGRTRQWAYDQLNWLRVTELVTPPYQFGPEVAKEFARLITEPELFAQAYAEALAVATPIQVKAAKIIVDQYVNYCEARDEWAKDNPDRPPMTLAEGKALASLPNFHGVLSRHPDAMSKGKDALLAYCAKEEEIPERAPLLKCFRGAELVEICGQLAKMQAEWDAAEAKVKRKKELQEELAEMDKPSESEMADDLQLEQEAQNDHVICRSFSDEVAEVRQGPITPRLLHRVNVLLQSLCGMACDGPEWQDEIERFEVVATEFLDTIADKPKNGRRRKKVKAS